MQFRHERVARDLGDDGCRGRTRAVAVGLDHRADGEPTRAGRRDVVVVAVQQHDRLFGDDALPAEVGERPDRGHPERPHDAELVDLGAAGPPHGARRHPRGGASRDIRSFRLRNELGVAQSGGDAPTRADRGDHGGADRHRAGQGAATDLVAGDHERVLAQEPALEGQPRLDDGHFDEPSWGLALAEGDGSGTPANTSGWKSRGPKRSSGHVMRNARPTTFSTGTKPLPG